MGTFRVGIKVKIKVRIKVGIKIIQYVNHTVNFINLFHYRSISSAVGHNKREDIT